MTATAFSGAIGAARTTGRLLTAVACCLLLGACAQIGTNASNLLSTQSTNPDANATTTATAPVEKPDNSRAELVKATEFWGKALAQNPHDPQTALNYARNLRAMGEKQHALAVLQQAASLNPTHRGLLGEYGRVALDLDQVTLAQKLLEQADDPAKPDWKVISARGTAAAKQGLYREAIALYERAMAQAPDQTSVVSNLALAYAMEGNADKAEPLLRRALAMGAKDPRINQNLALVLGLQGKYDEAKLIAGRDLPPDGASANVDYVQKIVQLQAKPLEVAAATQETATKPDAVAKQEMVAKQETIAKPAASTKQAAAVKPLAKQVAAQIKGPVDGDKGPGGWTTQVAVIKQ
jgi:Flp pilus assembly protein TadD